MVIRFGRAVCGDLAVAESREWLVTNGIGGYACGTVAGLTSRFYHGLLVAALDPPLGRVLMLAHCDPTVAYRQHRYELGTNRWADGSIAPRGYRYLESFHLDGSVPTWCYALADALLVQRIWMEREENSTYLQYCLERGSAPLELSIKAIANYRDHHGGVTWGNWQLDAIESQANPYNGIRMRAFPEATPLFLLSDRGEFTPGGEWYRGYDLAVERYRETGDREDRLHAATLRALMEPGATLTLVASTHDDVDLDGNAARHRRHDYDRMLVQRWQTAHGLKPPDWIEQLTLAADQFVVRRAVPVDPDGKTIIAGYPWFGDWGRDTAISLPGLSVAAGRPEIARPILRTFGHYLSQGMLPNLFPDGSTEPEYNTVDAVLWYFEAVRAYFNATGDEDLLRELYSPLEEAIAWHQRGTRYNIHLDSDGLLYAGEPGTQLTWMDAKVEDWVVTPRIGKPVEINALWFNALQIVVEFAQVLDRPYADLATLRDRARQSFARFWSEDLGYCIDVLDGPEGDDTALRPNQIFAVSVPSEPLLTPERQRAVVDTVSRHLLTSHGLRSLAPADAQYCPHYGGDRLQRDGCYHQGTVWGWLLGPFVQAHLRVYRDPATARALLQPMADHLAAGGLGTISEIFDGAPPHTPRGCFAQAWSVAEILRVWLALEDVAGS
ncbi:glycogen debranching enzyme [Rubidibacter lacunae KORDI 51-2]|uniref:Glycogen debranching enzyme n=1 Tax=Rubidibacter lacunae KORDI 51-2 TaxID=582515 RepID=U5DKG1_9CHRO|nr:amylo-alpha-1,6-glucosidase [Rubidibacter lacunae]ERN42156.1 glycogen debranching enzyme [Rubidibacter lacunae KORDI 51-2]